MKCVWEWEWKTVCLCVLNTCLIASQYVFVNVYHVCPSFFYSRCCLFLLYGCHPGVSSFCSSSHTFFLILLFPLALCFLKFSCVSVSLQHFWEVRNCKSCNTAWVCLFFLTFISITVCLCATLGHSIPLSCSSFSLSCLPPCFSNSPSPSVLHYSLTIWPYFLVCVFVVDCVWSLEC